VRGWSQQGSNLRPRRCKFRHNRADYRPVQRFRRSEAVFCLLLSARIRPCRAIPTVARRSGIVSAIAASLQGGG
jgi:hypothetical protein